MDAEKQIEILQQLVASQRSNIEALEAANVSLQTKLERSKAAMRAVDADEPKTDKKKRDSADKKPRKKQASGEKSAKRRSCKLCGDEILGFGCLKVECKAEQARRKAAAVAAHANAVKAHDA